MSYLTRSSYVHEIQERGHVKLPHELYTSVHSKLLAKNVIKYRGSVCVDVLISFAD